MSARIVGEAVDILVSSNFSLASHSDLYAALSQHLWAEFRPSFPGGGFCWGADLSTPRIQSGRKSDPQPTALSLSASLSQDLLHKISTLPFLSASLLPY